MTIGKIGRHLAPALSKPQGYRLFFIPNILTSTVGEFFANLDEPNEYFVLVPATRIDQLSWRPDRIKRNDVRMLTHQDDGVWVALTKSHHVIQLQAILEKHKHS